MSANLTLGWTVTKDGNIMRRPFTFPRKTLVKHVAILGASGSGKTVALKRIIEELALSGIPVIILDMQGDMSSLALLSSEKDLISKKHGPAMGEDWRDKVEVRVFTPGSVSGIQMNCSPLRPIPAKLKDEDVRALLDMTVEATLAAMHYKYSDDNAEYQVTKSYLYHVLEAARNNDRYPSTLPELRDLIEAYVGPKDMQDVGKTRKPKLIENIIATMTGFEGLLFTAGVPLSIQLLLTSVDPNKTAISIIHMGKLTTKEQKQGVSAVLANQVYTYLLQTNPEVDEGGDPKLKFALILDEVQDIMPADPYQPVSKRAFTALFRQARKYGCSLMVATQNWAATSYQLLGNASTILVGRTISNQDIEKTRDFFKGYVKGIESIDSLITEIPRVSPGEFFVASPDNWKQAHHVKFLMPMTEHYPISVESADRCNADYVKQYFAIMGQNPGGSEKKAKKGTLPVHPIQSPYNCHSCGTQLLWIPEFQRYWCPREKQYI